MSRLATVAALMMAGCASLAHAEVVVSPVVVRSGYYQAKDCLPTIDPKQFNECICKADIKKAQVAGLPADAMTAVNQQLALLPEKLAAESCEGTAIANPPVGVKINRATADFEVIYQTPTTLTALVNYATDAAGSDVPIEGTEGFTFDLVSGRVVDPFTLLKPEQLAKADAYIRAELPKKYPTLNEDAKTRTDPYLTASGCDSCTLYYGKDGWLVRFQLDTIAPHMTGEPEVLLPAELMGTPETLTTKK
jgi:hypothetical protein